MRARVGSFVSRGGERQQVETVSHGRRGVRRVTVLSGFHGSGVQVDVRINFDGLAQGGITSVKESHKESRARKGEGVE